MLLREQVTPRCEHEWQNLALLFLQTDVSNSVHLTDFHRRREK